MTVWYHPDFSDFLKCLEQAGVRYVIVGGYAVIFHGYQRTTGDLDIWTERTSDNYDRLKIAFQCFGMPVFDMTPDNFLNNPDMDVFTFGRSPVCIQIMTQVKGLTFHDAFSNSVTDHTSFGSVRYLSLSQLRLAKTAAGRVKDQNDLEHLI